MLILLMEGACVFIDTDNFSNLLIYKEIPDKIIFFAWYKLKELNIGYISIYDYYKLVPAKSIHANRVNMNGIQRRKKQLYQR